MKVRDFIALMSKPENAHLLDADFGIEIEPDNYFDVQHVYASTLVLSDDDEDERATAVTVAPMSLPVGKEEGGTHLFNLIRTKIV